MIKLSKQLIISLNYFVVLKITTLVTNTSVSDKKMFILHCSLLLGNKFLRYNNRNLHCALINIINLPKH